MLFIGVWNWSELCSAPVGFNPELSSAVDGFWSELCSAPDGRDPELGSDACGVGFGSFKLFIGLLSISITISAVWCTRRIPSKVSPNRDVRLYDFFYVKVVSIVNSLYFMSYIWILNFKDIFCNLKIKIK